MIKYFQRAFKITSENIILATPLILFLFFFSLYLGITKSIPANLPASILLLVTVIFMLSAFCAGWFYMVKKAVDLEKTEFIIEEDKAKASFNLIKEFPVGIGEYFFSFIGGLIFYCILMFLLVFITYELGLHFIGNIGLTVDQMKTALSSQEAMKSLVTSMSITDLARLNAWNLLILGVTVIFSFLTMFWPAQIIINKTKNPIMALLKAITAIFKKPLEAILLFIYISFINFVVSFINAISAMNPIFYFFSMLIYFYFLVYIVVLIFLYYDREIKAKSDNNEEEENNSDSGTDSIGQD